MHALSSNAETRQRTTSSARAITDSRPSAFAPAADNKNNISPTQHSRELITWHGNERTELRHTLLVAEYHLIDHEPGNEYRLQSRDLNVSVVREQVQHDAQAILHHDAALRAALLRHDAEQRREHAVERNRLLQ